MKLKNKYFILRHGQTIYQTKKKEFVYPPFPEKPGIKLTKKGEKQVKTAAEKLKKEKIDLIFASDFFRTKQTAKIVARILGISKIFFDKRLRDINVGIYHGKTKKELYQAFPRDARIRFSKRPEKGESWLDAQKRILNFLKDIDKKYKKKTILIVSHGDPLWLLEGAVKKWTINKLSKTSGANYIKTGELRKL